MARRHTTHLVLVPALLALLTSNALAAAIRWTNAAGGNWNVATNWSPAVVPTATDTAVIDLAGTYTVTVNVTPVTLAALRVVGAGSGTQTLSAASKTLTISGPVTIGALGVVTLSSCTVSGTGAIENYGAVNLTSSTIAPAWTNRGTLVCGGTCALNGTIGTVAGSVLRVTGISGLNSQLTVASGFTNNGTIELTSTGGTAATLAVTSGTLVNAIGASILSLPGTGGGRTLAATLDNRGTVSVTQALTLSKASAAHLNPGTIDLTAANMTISLSGTGASFTTTGALNVPTGRTLTLSGSNFYYSGGVLGGAGTLTLNSAILNLNAPYSSAMALLDINSSTIAGPSTLTIKNGTTVSVYSTTLNGPTVVESGGILDWTGTCNLNGTIGTVAGSVLRITGISGLNSQLTVASGFTNNGTIELTSTGGTAATLAVTSGTLVNAIGASILSLPGTGGGRTLAAILDNRGTVTASQALSVTKAAAAHINTGTIGAAAATTLTITGASFANQPGGILTGHGTLALATGTTFAQNGTVRPGGSCGVLTINGPCPSSATSVYDVELGAEVSGGYDRFCVRDAATLAGTLNLSVVDGYQPRPGVQHVIATFKSRTGTFATVNGLSYGPGMLWAVVYTDTNVVLLAMDQTWARLIPASGLPAARDGHTAVYDSTGDRMIVFGGLTDTGVRNDVWVLTKAAATVPTSPTWTLLSPSGTPPAARTNASAVYDPGSNRMIVYGGDNGAATPTVYGDAWVLTNANGTGGTPAWIALSPASLPPARSGAATTYDRASNRLTLYGGNATPAACGGARGDVWVLSNANGLGGSPAWTSLATSGTPPSARWLHGAGYDPATGRLIVTGGEDGCGGTNTETWLLDHANGLGGSAVWSRLTPATSPPVGWSRARYTYDAVDQWMDGFGGWMNGGYVDTAFTLTGASGSGGSGWYRRLSYGSGPDPRAFHSMIVNTRLHTAVVFGGRTAGGRMNDIWRHQLNQGAVLDVEPEPPVATLPERTGFAVAPGPNPTRGEVAMVVEVGRAQRVDLGVFDVSGRRVAVLHTGVLAEGRHAFQWTGRAAAGLYFLRLDAEDHRETVRLVRLN